MPNEGFLFNHHGNSSSSLEIRLKEAEHNPKKEGESRERESIFCENAVNDLKPKLKAMEQHLKIEQNYHEKPEPVLARETSA